MASCKGKRSGLAAPSVATLVVDPESPTTTALVVEPSTCAETAITRRPTEEPNEFRIIAGNMSLGAVTSLPTVQSLMVPNNNIKSLDVGSTVLFEIDLTNNLLTNLDSIKLPGSLKRLYLDFNPLKKITAGQLPSSLIELYMEKANIDSLAGFKFPNQLKILSIKGNRQLTSLYGLVMPTGITTFDCSDSAVTEVAGVTFPKTLQKMIVAGTKPLSTFDFRASDLALLSKMQLQATTVPGMTCPDSRGTITVITSTVSGCAYSDVDFAAKYPPIVVSEPPSSGRTPTPADGSSNSSPLAASPAPVPTGGGGGGGNSTQMIIVGVLVLVAVIVGVGIGFVFQRRRRAKRSSQDAEDDETRATSKRSKTKTKTDDRTGSYDHGVAPPNSNGFLENDVRNDEALIIHRVPQEEIVLVSKLAKGGFGIVYKAKLHSQDVVVKQITPDKADSTDAVKRFMDEIRLYSKLQHGKIVHFVGLSWTNLFDLSLIMEYMPNGDLHMLLRSVAAEKDIEFEWFKAHSDLRCKALMATDVAEALVYLHSYSPPIIHRDLKARNIMLAEDYTAKLGDFGISRVSAEDTMTGGMGTTAWIAPEVLQGERYSEKADIYSFGILLCEMDVCDHPYRSSHATGDETLTDAKIAFLVSTASLRPQLREDCPGAIQKLIYECIDFDPAKRPSAVELHYNIRKVREAALEWGFV